uniref:BEN domain-containing protein n=1 Tax=Anopheles stephensi TaxID=30069 RepID=A0A182Y4F0_ANOST
MLVCEEKRISKSAANSDCSDTDETVAVFAKTMRGKEQLIYMGQPFVFEKLVLTHGGESKKIWRCNQWWNQRCRARVYTIDRQVTPLNRYHTHVDIVKRKQRVVRRERSGTGGCGTINATKVTTAGTPVATKSANTAVHGQQPQQQLPPSSTAAAPITKPTEHQTTLGGSGSSNKPRLPRLVDGVRHKIYDQVPLHAGSSVYIATKGLLSIYTSKPAVYTGRLVELMFGVETLKRSCLNGSEQTDPGLVPLDPTILDAVITHIVDVFQQQRQHITTGMVRNFIRNRMELLRTNAAIGGVDKQLTKRKGTELISLIDNQDVAFGETDNGGKQLTYRNYIYHRNLTTGSTVYWRCSKAMRLKCKATIVTRGDLMRVNNVEHNHVPMRRLTYGLAIFIAISPERQLIRLRDKLYQKTIGRAYRSVWTCIEYGCPGEIVLRELKGGQIKITSAHNDDCTSDYFKNRPAHQMHLNESELTQLELSMANRRVVA